MKTVSLSAEAYLGKKLFELYEEKHPNISSDTKVIEVRRDYGIWGFQVQELGYGSIFDTSPIANIPKTIVTIKPEQFETWAESKDSRFYRLAFVDQLNTLYVATLD